MAAYLVTVMKPDEKTIEEVGDYNTCLDGISFSQKLANIIQNMLPENARSAISLAEILTEQYGGMPYSEELSAALDAAREAL